jgi:flagellin-like hook-associated protein FlgL
MLAVAESGLSQMNDILTEMKAKATSAASDTLGDEERAAISAQLRSLAQQINDIVTETTWNDEGLLGGSISKSLQTGAGTSDVTVWTLDQNHQATELEVATSSGNALFSSLATVASAFNTTADTLTGASYATAFSGLATLSTGNYKFTILDKAVGANTGNAAATATAVAAVAGVGGLTETTAAGDELASGHYKIILDVASTANTLYYSIEDQDGGLVAATNSAAITGGAVTLLGNGDAGIGVKLTGVVGTDVVASSIHFEYIEKDTAKMALYQVSGSTETAVQVDSNGTDDSATFGVNDTRSYFYASTSATYDTGVGIEVALSTIGDITASSYTSFSYTEANDLTVSLLDNDDATEYMTKVDTALQIVTSSLNDIGSLVSRLDAKEEAVGG